MEAFLPAEQKLFLRAVEVQPRPFNWGLVLAFAFNVAAWGGIAVLLWRI